MIPFCNLARARDLAAERAGGVDKAPDAFRTISEVADELDLPQHVLRFWESRFTQIRPMKRGGGRRYYRPDDVALLRGIRHLLYGQGYTIRGVQRILRERGGRFVQTVWEEANGEPDGATGEAAGFEQADEMEERGVGRGGGLLGFLRTQDAALDDDAPEPVPLEGRREPTLSPPPQRPPIEPRAGGVGPGVAKLRAALDELAECRRLLDQALEDAAQSA